jgi:hypothetical protein
LVAAQRAAFGSVRVLWAASSAKSRWMAIARKPDVAFDAARACPARSALLADALLNLIAQVLCPRAGMSIA